MCQNYSTTLQTFQSSGDQYPGAKTSIVINYPVINPAGDQTLFKMVINLPVINLPVINLPVINRPHRAIAR